MWFFMARLSVFSMAGPQYVIIGRAGRDRQPQCRIKQRTDLQQRVQKIHDAIMVIVQAKRIGPDLLVAFQY